MDNEEMSVNSMYLKEIVSYLSWILVINVAHFVFYFLEIIT